jgi:hypothetical protein
MLLRIALSDAGQATTAVMKALLAVSAYHRFGCHLEVIQLQGHALHALLASSRDSVGPKDGVKHIAAGMLLCTLEVCV